MAEDEPDHIVLTDKRHGEADRRHGMAEQNESSGNTKWIMGLIGSAVLSGWVGWQANVDRSVNKSNDLQVSFAELKVEMKLRQEFVSAELARLARVIEDMKADQEERRRAK